MSIKIEECVICDNALTEYDETAKRFLDLPEDINVKRCRQCGLRWLYPMMSVEEYSELYKLSYFDEIPQDYEKVVVQRLRHYRERIKKILKYFNNRKIRLLDVGAATGEFVNEARKTGIDATGIEPSLKACQRAKERYGIDLIQGDFLVLDINERFDVIHMHHVFEHFLEPGKCLERVRDLLNDNGLFVLEVPNQFDNIYMDLRILKRKPFSVYSVHHPYFYSPNAITTLLIRYGFEVENLKTWKSYLKGKSRRIPGSEYFFHYIVLFLADLLLKRGLFIEVYATKNGRRKK